MKFNSKHLFATIISLSLLQGFTYIDPKGSNHLSPIHKVSRFHEYDTSSAQFKGGNDSLLRFISENITYPKNAARKGNSGKSIVEFTIQISGTISNVHIAQSSGHDELDNEAMRVVKLTSGLWMPSFSNGNPVNSVARIPIIFELDE